MRENVTREDHMKEDKLSHYSCSGILRKKIQLHMMTGIAKWTH